MVVVKEGVIGHGHLQRPLAREPSTHGATRKSRTGVSNVGFEPPQPRIKKTFESTQ